MKFYVGDLCIIGLDVPDLIKMGSLEELIYITENFRTVSLYLHLLVYSFIN
jgi:hypothetical protein